ncbi:hypothetical protein QEV83_05815 [Methylocapsa sp. D3K7]|uniref:hypothetical protein n=1 Tax=Methylocapsa sp. D3K7 TaxID=3041435 RepID=UPI00244EC80E|nr:hypothetical protein [Methylocapsa sp. D3K7]WGJ15775.1 hypothetical protein QEV83_05815 [Methylocapsa sp. D3K7]
MRRAIIIPAFLLGSACATSVTVPLAVISEHGEILRGTNTSALSGGSFSVTNGKITCTGSYNAVTDSKTLTVPILCSDGRTGIATATRDTQFSGGGKVRFSDGSEGNFIYGDAASRI